MRSNIRSLMAIIFLMIAGSIGHLDAQKLTLEGALQLANKNAPLAIMAHERVAVATSRVRQAESALYPNLTISSSYVSSDNPVQAFMYALNQGKFSLSADVNNPPRADNWQLTVQTGLRIFSGGRDLAIRRAAKAAKLGEQGMEQVTANEVSLKITKAFLDLLTAQQFARSSETAVNAYMAAEDVVAARLDVGAALRTDLLDIQVQRIQAEDQQLRAANTLALAQEGLKMALGLDSLPYSEFAALDEVTIQEPAGSELSIRPEVAARDAYTRAARAELTAAKAAFLPSINLFATADRYQGWEFGGTNHNWTIGLTAEWAIFDGFLTHSQATEKQAYLKISEEASRMARLQASFDLISAKSSMLEATKRVAVMAQAVTLASESTTLTRQRFEQGLAITSQIINAENALVQAEVGLAQAKADRLYAIASLRRALNLPIIGE